MPAGPMRWSRCRHCGDICHIWVGFIGPRWLHERERKRGVAEHPDGWKDYDHKAKPASTYSLIPPMESRVRIIFGSSDPFGKASWRGVGKTDGEWWLFSGARVGHLRVGITDEETQAMWSDGSVPTATADAGPEGVYRPRTAL